MASRLNKQLKSKNDDDFRPQSETEAAEASIPAPTGNRKRVKASGKPEMVHEKPEMPDPKRKKNAGGNKDASQFTEDLMAEFNAFWEKKMADQAKEARAEKGGTALQAQRDAIAQLSKEKSDLEKKVAEDKTELTHLWKTNFNLMVTIRSLQSVEGKNSNPDYLREDMKFLGYGLRLWSRDLCEEIGQLVSLSELDPSQRDQVLSAIPGYNDSLRRHPAAICRALAAHTLDPIFHFRFSTEESDFRHFEHLYDVFCGHAVDDEARRHKVNEWRVRTFELLMGQGVKQMEWTTETCPKLERLSKECPKTQQHLVTQVDEALSCLTKLTDALLGKPAKPERQRELRQVIEDAFGLMIELRLQAHRCELFWPNLESKETMTSGSQPIQLTNETFVSTPKFVPDGFPLIYRPGIRKNDPEGVKDSFISIPMVDFLDGYVPDQAAVSASPQKKGKAPVKPDDASRTDEDADEQQ